MSERVTIITVVLNAERTIERALKSVLDQSYDNYEYIVIDGGSTDGTLDKIIEYKALFESKGVSFRYTSGKDNGIYDAMNKGIDLLSDGTSWVNFLNADDYYADANVLNDLFADKVEDKIGAIYGDSIILRENGQQYVKKASAIDSLNYKCAFVHQALFVRDSIIRNYPFSLKWRLASDYEQWIRMYLDGIVYQYVERNIIVFDASGASGKAFNKYVQEMLQIQSELGLTRKYKMRRFIRNKMIPVIKESKAVFFVYALIRKNK